MLKIFLVSFITLTFCTVLPCVSTLSQNTTSVRKKDDTEIHFFRKYHMKHTLRIDDSNDFVSRGTVSLVEKDDGEFGIIVEQENIVIGERAIQFDHLVASNQLYQLKFIDDITEREILISVPACDLRRSNFREEIILMVGLSGSIISALYTPKMSILSPSCHTIPSLTTLATIERFLSFQTKVTISTGEPAMTVPLVIPPLGPPPGLNWITSSKSSENIHKSPQTFILKEFQDNTTKNQSFLRRYWYIIIPLFLMTCIGNGESESIKNETKESTNNGKTSVLPFDQRLLSSKLSRNSSKKETNGTTRQRRGKRD